MRPDTENLIRFYESPEGMLARRLILRAVRRLWPEIADGSLVGFGHTAPWLPALGRDLREVLSLAPWPVERGTAPVFCAVVDADALPLASGSVSRVFAAHLLEHVGDVSAVLAEVWRVLEDGGEMVCVVSARGGVWSRREESPFGSGAPFSRRQLGALLRARGLVPVAAEGALFAAPGGWRRFSAVAAERFGRRWFPRRAGVHVVLARKEAPGAEVVEVRRSLSFGAARSPLLPAPN
ncbi:MAG: class I SAM-dependent methyltransferase [Alphaproteobacteria bacterium]|nr:class I SAM-dependent methyltransferase [Alphaproteobacteria bacterium]MDA8009579.1 class I SAM-dependent methyltransferase [Alphaproteobacteria bacterium]